MNQQNELRKQLETEINKNKSILEGCVDAVVTINQEGVIEFINKAAETLFGYDRKELLGKNVKILTPPEYRIHHDEFIKRYLETKVAKVIGSGREVNALNKDGEEIPILLTLSQAIVEGKYIFTAFIKDYTEKKKNEEELRKLSLVASKTDNTVIITDKDRKIEWVNDGFTRMTGYHIDEVIGLNPKVKLQGKDTDRDTQKRMRKKLKSKKPFSEVLLNYKKNHDPFWVSINITPILDDTGNIMKYIAIESDITDQRRLQERLQENEKRLIETQQIAGLGTWEYDLANKKVSWSPETFKIFELKSSENSPDFGKFIRLIYKENRIKFINAVREAIDSGKEYEIEIRIKLHDGSIRYTYSKGRPIYVKKKVVKLLGAVLDITERKNFENELKKEKEKAEASAKAKELFLANTSHEIRTPMNAIIGIIELLKKTSLSEDQLDYLGIIESSSDNLLYILNDILDVSKIESGKLEFEQTGFRMKEVIKNVLKTSIYKARAKHLELSCNVGTKHDDLILLGDPVRLNQILLNLVNNAIKFTEKGHVIIDVTSKSKADNQLRLKFHVIDTGIGIPEEKQQQIFEDFEQADTSTTRKYGGTGLGLSISRKLIEMMGGKLKVQSIVGKGSTFSFELNFRRGSHLDLQDSKIGQEYNIKKLKLSDKSILIVEDQEFNLLIVRQILEPYGCRIDNAFNGKEAIKKFTDNNYDLILMDIQMPVMDGIETTRFIRDHMPYPKSGIPIIALTAHAIKGDREKYLNLGMNNYLSKPFQARELILTIAQELKLDILTPEEDKRPQNLSGQKKLYDLSQINEMSGGNKEFVIQMITSFIEQTKMAITEMKDQIDKMDYAEIAKIAHKHKTSFSFMGIQSLFEEIINIEEAALNRTPLGKIKKIVETVEKSLVDVYNDLNEEIKHYS